MFGPLPEKLTPEMQQAMLEAMRTQMPALRTQAQYNAFCAAFDALRLTMNAIFEGNAARQAEGKKALDLSLDIAQKVTAISEQLREVPEAAGTVGAELFTRAPAELQEHDIQRALLSELAQLETLEELSEWYMATPTVERRGRVVSQNLRNVLMDSIRERKAALTPKG